MGTRAVFWHSLLGACIRANSLRSDELVGSGDPTVSSHPRASSYGPWQLRTTFWMTFAHEL